MKFTSLNKSIDELQQVIVRFPFETLAAFVGTYAGFSLVSVSSYYNAESYTFWIRILLVSNLSFLLFLGTSLYSESVSSTPPKKWLLKGVALILTFLLYLLLDPYKTSDEIFGLKFLLSSIGLHLCISFAPFIGKSNADDFWQFNKALFLRFLTSALYSSVLYLGIAAAIATSDYLFETQIDYHIYGWIFVFISGIFNTLFFLAGVPSNLNQPIQDGSYPKGLKIFTQFVLIPLASVYLIILLLYELKIIASWSLPKGWVSNLIIGYAVFGILSTLLIHPIQNKEENKWISIFSKSFYLLLIPLIILLSVAVGTRINNYGITELRYIILALAVWLSFVTIYMLLSKRKSIRIIPISLCLLSLASVYGPQSAFSISEYSQQKRLYNLFKKYNAIRDHKLIPLPDSVKNEDYNQADDILDHLVDQYGPESVLEIIHPDKINNTMRDSLLNPPTTENYAKRSWNKSSSRVLTELLNVIHTPSYDETYSYYGYTLDKNGIKGDFESIYTADRYELNDLEYKFDENTFVLNEKNDTCIIVKDIKSNKTITFDLQEKIAELEKKYPYKSDDSQYNQSIVVETEDIQFKANFGTYRLTLIPSNLTYGKYPSRSNPAKDKARNISFRSIIIFANKNK